MLVSDSAHAETGSREFRAKGGRWLLVHAGRCSILLDPGFARLWRCGGSVRHDSAGGRCLGVVVPLAGRRSRGKVTSLISVYAPVSSPALDLERRTPFDDLSFMIGSLPSRSTWFIGGDFNASLGYRGALEQEVIGPFSHGKRSRTGKLLLEWFVGEGLVCLETFTRQWDRTTWYHPHDGSGHALDHAFCRPQDLKHDGAVKGSS